jgi:hypothetical protein
MNQTERLLKIVVLAGISFCFFISALFFAGLGNQQGAFGTAIMVMIVFAGPVWWLVLRRKPAQATTEAKTQWFQLILVVLLVLIFVWLFYKETGISIVSLFK